VVGGGATGEGVGIGVGVGVGVGAVGGGRACDVATGAGESVSDGTANPLWEQEDSTSAIAG
jgi:hypothetical protein